MFQEEMFIMKVEVILGGADKSNEVILKTVFFRYHHRKLYIAAVTELTRNRFIDHKTKIYKLTEVGVVLSKVMMQ
mgnify:CR=1 FL=1